MSGEYAYYISTAIQGTTLITQIGKGIDGPLPSVWQQRC